MADGEEKGGGGDFYSVLGLDKACTSVELRSAYKKLAMRWHPDRCHGSGDSKAEEAKSKFQEIQEAYSVLSDTNKRSLYDVGVYQSDHDDNHHGGMGEFMDELAAMMRKTAPCTGTQGESFAELQNLFMEMFEKDLGGVGGANFHRCDGGTDGGSGGGSRGGLKRDCGKMSSGSGESAHMMDPLSSSGMVFCYGFSDSVDSSRSAASGRRKHKASSRRNVS